MVVLAELIQRRYNVQQQHEATSCPFTSTGVEPPDVVAQGTHEGPQHHYTEARETLHQPQRTHAHIRWANAIHPFR